MVSFDRPSMAEEDSLKSAWSCTKPVRGEIYRSEAAELLRWLPDASADVVFLDPPFNLGKAYDDQRDLDRRPADEYRLWLTHILDEATRILKDGGTLFVYHIPSWAIRLAAHLDSRLQFRHWVAVAMKNGFVRGDRLYPAHYALLYFTKGAPAFFQRPRVAPETCRHCDGYVRDYGGYVSIIEENGVNLSDVWTDLSPVRHRSTKTRVANELPLKMTDRIVEMSCRRGMTFVDPFAGSGSTLVSAMNAGVNFIGGDIVEANCHLMAQRLADTSHAKQNRRRNGLTSQCTTS
jgi:site-specific DNA-methyltransferase (adenine-specific)